MPSLARKKYFVYSLSMDRPGKYVFYVGKGSGNRPYAHGIEARDFYPSLKCAVIRYLYAHNEPYHIRYVYDTDDEEEAYWREMKTIVKYPVGTLCNVFGSYRTPSHRIYVTPEGGGWWHGVLLNAKSEQLFEVARTTPTGVSRDLIIKHDEIVLPPYLEKIQYVRLKDIWKRYG